MTHERLPEPFTDVEHYVSLAYPQYAATALWSSTDGNRELDSVTNVDDLPAETRAALLKPLTTFVLEHWDIVRHWDPTDVAHDLWLNQHHHGCGFWDGDWPTDISATLDEAASALKEIDLYVIGEQVLAG